MPARESSRFCTCIICTEGGSSGCYVANRDWSSHQRLGKERQRRGRSQNKKDDDGHRSETVNDNIEGNSVDNELPEAADIMFALAVNDELMSGNESDPLWSQGTDTNLDFASLLKPGLKDTFATSELAAAINEILPSPTNVSSPKFTPPYNAPSPYKGILKKAAIYRHIVRPIRSSIEKGVDLAMSRIHAKRAMARLHRCQSYISDLEAQFKTYKSYNPTTHKDFSTMMSSLRQELESINRNLKPIKELRAVLLKSLDTLEGKLNVIGDSKPADESDPKPTVFITGMSILSLFTISHLYLKITILIPRSTSAIQSPRSCFF